MKIMYFGTYDPQYSRNKILIKGLRQNGLEVIECNEHSSSFFKYLKLSLRYLKIRLDSDYDVMVVGFSGHKAVFLAKFLTILSYFWPKEGSKKRPIIFDAFTSHYGGYILDRQKFSPQSWQAKIYRFLDEWSCRLADVVLLDTRAHIDFFVKEYGLSAEKFRRIWIGADDGIFYPRVKEENNIFTVIFFGTYVPLQGVEYIVRAAKILERENISFIFVGRGQDCGKAQALTRELGVKNIDFKGMMRAEELALEISKADISLGLFGQTPKTPLVIPNKIYESLAAQKAVITAETPAIKELFTEDEILMTEAGNPQALADSILKLKNNREYREQLALRGYQKYQQEATPKVLGRQLSDIIKGIRNQ